MAYALDIEDNLPVPAAAVADAKARGVVQIVGAGEMTGDGPFPEEVCRFLEEQCIPAIIGSDDQKVIEVAKRSRSAAARIKQKKMRSLT